MVFIQDKDKKPFPKIFIEFFKLWLTKRSFPLHYFGRFLYRKEFTKPANYMDMKEFRSFINANKNNEPQFVHLLENKFMFSLFCKEHGLSTATNFSYNLKDTFFLDNKPIKVRSITDLKFFFSRVFKLNGIEELFLKSFNGYGGKEVFLLQKDRLDEKLIVIGNQLLNNCYVHQKVIKQHKNIGEIYPHSVNTIRIETYIDTQGNIHILGTLMRFGCGGKVIDNVSSGGFYVPIDKETGCLKEKGFRSMVFGGEQLKAHPDTNYIFENFKVPFFLEALDLVKKFTNCIPNRLIGWDIAITESGPLVLEGNNTPGITIGEIGNGGYVSHPLFSDMMSNLN